MPHVRAGIFHWGPIDYCDSIRGTLDWSRRITRPNRLAWIDWFDWKASNAWNWLDSLLAWLDSIISLPKLPISLPKESEIRLPNRRCYRMLPGHSPHPEPPSLKIDSLWVCLPNLSFAYQKMFECLPKAALKLLSPGLDRFILLALFYSCLDIFLGPGALILSSTGIGSVL